MSNILIISTSLRQNSNSETLAKNFSEGAKIAKHKVEFVTLRNYHNIAFCKGCMACQKIGHCVINDDAITLAKKMLTADVICFATPIYYYTMCGQMKTLLDRCNSLYNADYRFRRIYLLMTAAENEPYTPEKTITSLQGWVDCFEKATLAATLFAGGVNDAGEIYNTPILTEAFNLGKNL